MQCRTLPRSRVSEPFSRSSARPARSSVHAQRRRSVAVRANFLEGIINNISVAVTSSPLNEGKKQLAIQQAGQYDVAAVKAKVDAAIANNAVVVFSWSRCPFCIKAKGLLNDLGAKYTALELDEMGAEGSAMRAELAKMTNRTSMPNIFISGQGIGGCNDGPGLLTLHRQGQLEPKLKAAGAL